MIRPIVGDTVEYRLHDSIFFCTVTKDHSSAIQRFNYDPTQASLALRTSDGTDGNALWSASEYNNVILVETDWTMRLFAILVVISHAVRVDRNRLRPGDRAIDKLRACGLL